MRCKVMITMHIGRKECEKIKMAINFDYDFSGWATKANVKCFDGLDRKSVV